METNTLVRKKTSARDYIKKFVLKYTKDNLEKLNAQNSSVDKNILKDIRKNEFTLDWILSEVLKYGDFKDLGIIVKNEWNDQDNESVYKIGKKYIRQTFTRKELYLKPTTFEFARLVKKKVIVYEYEPIK